MSPISVLSKPGPELISSVVITTTTGTLQVMLKVEAILSLTILASSHRRRLLQLPLASGCEPRSRERTNLMSSLLETAMQGTYIILTRLRRHRKERIPQT
jgi:hypothetical protein